MNKTRQEVRKTLDDKIIDVLREANQPLTSAAIRSTVAGQGWVSPGSVAESIWRLERAGEVSVDKGMSITIVKSGPVLD